MCLSESMINYLGVIIKLTDNILLKKKERKRGKKKQKLKRKCMSVHIQAVVYTQEV
jgi:hypothetical protein